MKKETVVCRVPSQHQEPNSEVRRPKPSLDEIIIDPSSMEGFLPTKKAMEGAIKIREELMEGISKKTSKSSNS